MQIVQETQEKLVRVQNKGLITIPRDFRKALGLNENSMARIKKTNNRLIFEPVTILTYLVRRYTGKEVKEFLAFDRKESSKLKKKGLL